MIHYLWYQALHSDKEDKHFTIKSYYCSYDLLWWCVCCDSLMLPWWVPGSLGVVRCRMWICSADLSLTPGQARNLCPPHLLSMSACIRNRYGLSWNYTYWQNKITKSFIQRVPRMSHVLVSLPVLFSFLFAQIISYGQVLKSKYSR